MTNQTSLEIADALENFLQRGRIKGVYIAGGTTPPPQLAYFVTFPRLSVVFGGDDNMEIQQDDKSCIIKIKLDALTTLATIPQRSPTDRLLVEAVLHS